MTTSQLRLYASIPTKKHVEAEPVMFLLWGQSEDFTHGEFSFLMKVVYSCKQIVTRITSK